MMEEEDMGMKCRLKYFKNKIDKQDTSYIKLQDVIYELLEEVIELKNRVSNLESKGVNNDE
jgi:hypothetical protein